VTEAAICSLPTVAASSQIPWTLGWQITVVICVIKSSTLALVALTVKVNRA
jgi:hypothetical protein